MMLATKEEVQKAEGALCALKKISQPLVQTLLCLLPAVWL